jgi:hypothetical protein
LDCVKALFLIIATGFPRLNLIQESLRHAFVRIIRPSAKLHDSLNAVCARAHVEDALLPDLVANAVHRAVMKTERNGEIHADQIKLLVFNSLSDIATDNLYENELKKRAVALREAWDEYEHSIPALKELCLCENQRVTGNTSLYLDHGMQRRPFHLADNLARCFVDVRNARCISALFSYRMRRRRI